MLRCHQHFQCLLTSLVVWFHHPAAQCQSLPYPLLPLWSAPVPVVLLHSWEVLNRFVFKRRIIKSINNFIYFTLYSLAVFSLARSLQLILEISATYRLGSYLLADNWLICRLRAQCMIPIPISIKVPCSGVYVVIFFKTISRVGFSDILNNQGLGKCYPFSLADNTYLDLGLFWVSQNAHPVIIYTVICWNFCRL